jgi:hypothetical protein
MNDTPRQDDAKRPQEDKSKPLGEAPLSDRDEATPGTPGTGENIDPKTGEKYTEGIGGA